MKLKKGDTVIIIGGKDKGKTGEISKVFPKNNRVLVKGVNQFKRHLKSKEGIEGGIITLERPLPVSSVSILDPKTKKPTKIGYKIIQGKKVRFAKKSGVVLDKPDSTKTKTKKPTKSKQN